MNYIEFVDQPNGRVDCVIPRFQEAAEKRRSRMAPTGEPSHATLSDYASAIDQPKPILQLHQAHSAPVVVSSVRAIVDVGGES